MHKVKPGQQVRILTLEVAVPADAEDGEVADQMSAYLSENGTDKPDSVILDWGYTDYEGRIVTASDDPEEGEIFTIGVEAVCEHCGKPAEYNSELILCPVCEAKAGRPRTLYIVRHQDAGDDGGAEDPPLLITWNRKAADTVANEKLKEILEEEADEDLPDDPDKMYELWEDLNTNSPYGLAAIWVDEIAVPAWSGAGTPTDPTMDEPALVPDEENEPASDYTLVGDSCWVGTDNFSIYIRKAFTAKTQEEDGIIVEVFRRKDGETQADGPLDTASAYLDDLEEGEETEEGVECSECPTLVYPDDPYYSTPCGTYCEEHMQAHLEECEICRGEFQD
ncbi:MAG: hypothetical protein KJ077_10925 [Anaerolineae bacterium]|nr:hypothetical protein [Anaerolineae bacterium]